MPESTGHGSAHTDRLHHHRARVAHHRAHLDQQARDPATGRYAPEDTRTPPSGPLGAENGAPRNDH